MESSLTFEDLTIDDTLPALERVVRYSCSNIALQRLVHVKMMTEIAENVGYDQAAASFLPLLPYIVEDPEFVVRQYLAEQLAGLAKFFVQASPAHGYRVLLEALLPAIAKLVADQKIEVRTAAGATLVTCCNLLHATDIGQHALTIALRLAHDDDHEEMRMTAAGILNDMADSMGPDLCQQFLVPELVSLSDDPVFRVRKAAALSLHGIARTAGPSDSRRRLLPAYMRLSKDDMYRVRKACAENLPEFAKSVDEATREGPLIKVFTRLAEDNSWIVRHSALQSLGPFIATLPETAVSEELVNHFTSMAIDKETGQMQSEQELREKCAWAFPAVCQKLGPRRWSELRAAYRMLLSDRLASVRKTLAHSLHTIAGILTDIAEQELLSVFDAFLKDSDEVRVGTLKSFSSFLAHLPPETQIKCLPKLGEVLKTTTVLNWRSRLIVASQLALVCSLVPDANAAEAHLLPVALTLLEDPVLEVQCEVFKALPQLIQLTEQQHPNESDSALRKIIRDFSSHHSYQKRQVFILICVQLSQKVDRSRFKSDFISLYSGLSDDKVISVRIALARSFHNIAAWLREEHEVQVAILKLQEDSCYDVMHLAIQIDTTCLSERINSMSVCDDKLKPPCIKQQTCHFAESTSVHSPVDKNGITCEDF